MTINTAIIIKGKAKTIAVPLSVSRPPINIKAIALSTIKTPQNARIPRVGVLSAVLCPFVLNWPATKVAEFTDVTISVNISVMAMTIVMGENGSSDRKRNSELSIFETMASPIPLS